MGIQEIDVELVEEGLEVHDDEAQPHGGSERIDESLGPLASEHAVRDGYEDRDVHERHEQPMVPGLVRRQRGERRLNAGKHGKSEDRVREDEEGKRTDQQPPAPPRPAEGPARPFAEPRNRPEVVEDGQTVDAHGVRVRVGKARVRRDTGPRGGFGAA